MFKHLCLGPQISSGFFLFIFLVGVSLIYLWSFLCVCFFFCFYAAGLNISVL